MKFYMHNIDLDFTTVMHWNNESTGDVMAAVEIFLKSLQVKYPDKVKDIEKSSICVKNQSKRLRHTDPVVKTVKNMDDLYITWSVQNESQKTQAQEDAETLNHNADTADSMDSSMKKSLALATSLYRECRLCYAMALYKDVLKLKPDLETALIGLGDCYLKACRYSEAKQYFTEVNDINKVGYRLGECYLHMGEVDHALQTLVSYREKLQDADIHHQHDVQVMLARAYLAKGEKDNALKNLQNVLLSDQDHEGALTEYAELTNTFSPQHKEESMTIMLKLLSQNKDDAGIKRSLARLVCHEDGLAVLQRSAGPVWQNVSVIVFIATSIRDAGAVEEALKLMEHAYNLDKQNAHTLLTYVHMLELVEGHSTAANLIRQYINTFPEMSIGQFRCGQIISLVNLIKEDIYLQDSSVDASNLEVVLSCESELYDEDLRYLLAVLFTLVKILYVKGFIGILSPILHYLKPLEEKQNLHQTNIRNEAAYYKCIKQIITESFPPLPDRSKSFIYFIGDSHCLPPAWQTITYKNEVRTIHPILATGTKIWHLRDESYFYPKHDFYSSISIVPPKSEVIVCFGEIDCREAILLCVEKGKYDSIEDAIETIVEIYIKLLIDLQNKHQWRIYVHPVMPVLDVTRSLVLQFNKNLSDQVNNKNLSDQVKNTCSIMWLDFVHDLLIQVNGQQKLKPSYDLDGTHAHPSYLPLLERALSELINC